MHDSVDTTFLSKNCFFTAKKGPKKPFFNPKKSFFEKEILAEKYCSHQENKSQIFPDFLMIISSQKRQNKIAKTKKAPGNRIRVNIYLYEVIE